MTAAADDRAPANLGEARAFLESAYHRLEKAVRGLAGTEGDTVMASPGLVLLLRGVVHAREQVRGLERAAATELVSVPGHQRKN